MIKKTILFITVCLVGMNIFASSWMTENENNSTSENGIHPGSYSPYYSLIIKAMTLEACENYNEAYTLYKDAFNTAYPFVDDILQAIGCCKKSDYSEEIPSLIRKLILSGYKRIAEDIPVTVREDGKNYIHIREREFKYPEYEACFNAVYDSCRAEYLIHINKETDRHLSAFNQFEFFTALMRRLCSNEKEQIALQIVAWGATCKLFLDLYNSDINISRQRTDTWNDDVFIACLIHTGQISPDINREDKYFSFLRQMVLAGNLHPRQYAQIEDAVRTRKTGKSYYGESLSFDSNEMRIKISKLDNPAEVDKRRAELFIPPLWVTAKLGNYILPPNYKH